MEPSGQQLNIKSNNKGNKVIKSVDFNQSLSKFLEVLENQLGNR